MNHNIQINNTSINNIENRIINHIRVRIIVKTIRIIKEDTIIDTIIIIIMIKKEAGLIKNIISTMSILVEIIRKNPTRKYQRYLM